MNRPKRPNFPPKKRKPTTTRGPATGQGGGSRRRSPLDMVPQNAEPRFRVLGTNTDRTGLMTFAQPVEMLFIHGYTAEIERAYSEFNGRPDDFWAQNPELLEKAHKIDEVLAGIVKRKTGGR